MPGKTRLKAYAIKPFTYNAFLLKCITFKLDLLTDDWFYYIGQERRYRTEDCRRRQFLPPKDTTHRARVTGLAASGAGGRQPDALFGRPRYCRI